MLTAELSKRGPAHGTQREETMKTKIASVFGAFVLIFATSVFAHDEGGKTDWREQYA